MQRTKPSEDTRDWRHSAGKTEAIAETFGDVVPASWWYHFGPRKPTDDETAAAIAAFRRTAGAMVAEARLERSTAIQGRPWVLFVQATLADPCVEIQVGDRVWPLYLVKRTELDGPILDFVRAFGEADNPFRRAPPSPAP